MINFNEIDSFLSSSKEFIENLANSLPEEEKKKLEETLKSLDGSILNANSEIAKAKKDLNNYLNKL